jgi:hypothetical protein
MHGFDMHKAHLILGYAMGGFCYIIGLLVNSEICLHVNVGSLCLTKYIYFLHFYFKPLHSVCDC